MSNKLRKAEKSEFDQKLKSTSLENGPDLNVDTCLLLLIRVVLKANGDVMYYKEDKKKLAGKELTVLCAALHDSLPFFRHFDTKLLARHAAPRRSVRAGGEREEPR